MPEDVKKPERGSIYLRGDTYWVKYYKHGRPFRESSKTDNPDKALRFLKYKLTQIDSNRFVEPRLQRVLVRDLYKPFLANLGDMGRKDVVRVERRWKNHLEPVFGDERVANLTGSALSQYAAERRQEGASNATVNRELAILARMLHLGYKADPQTVTRIPPFPKLQESTPRQGFLADGDYDKLAAECAREGLWLRAMLAVYYNFGWRRNEVIRMRVPQVDLASRTLRLEAGSTKNGKARTARMTEEVYTLLAACVEGKGADDYVFTRKKGKLVGDFRKTWAKVLKRAGIPPLLIHDLRRTGARNLRRLGLAEGTIMAIGGWKTNSVFKRYDIVSEDDLADAARRLDEKRRAQSAVWAQNGHNQQELATKTVQVANGGTIN